MGLKEVGRRFVSTRSGRVFFRFHTFASSRGLRLPFCAPSREEIGVSFFADMLRVLCGVLSRLPGRISAARTSVARPDCRVFFCAYTSRIR